MRRKFLYLLAVLALAAAPLVLRAVVTADSDEDDTLSLSPVKKGFVSPTAAPTDVPTAVPTATAAPTEEEDTVDVDTAVPTQAPTPVPPTPTATAVPTPRPKPVVHASTLLSVESRRADDGVHILMKAAGPIVGAAANLSAPERVLVKLSGATLLGSKLPKMKPVGLDGVQRVRIAAKNATELWVVADLTSRQAFKTSQPTRDSFEIVLVSGAPRPSPAATPRSLAEIPKINLMLFDENVIYQDKQYAEYPCANFIYNVSDQFPLKREFKSTLVFSHGYGAFVGNARILDPRGMMLAQTERPFAFNLFNALAENMVELPWRVEFKDKGTYFLMVDLNGSDVWKQPFYVGQNTDIPPAQ